ncbi:MAG TPA: DUF3291 domain-containing protein [Actinobacteria bacterium]|nr:DUF3291 domain-containing protein [Actinomycetota bacterium]
MTYHLAQFNVGRLAHPLNAPESQGFVEQLETVNALADAHPGFVWRLQTDEGDATSIDPYGDPRVIVNFSVWEDADSLKQFTYAGTHGEVFRQRTDWFEPRDKPMLVLWWIPAGHMPGINEAVAKLDHLRSTGPSPEAFTFGRFVDAPSDDIATTV